MKLNTLGMRIAKISLATFVAATLFTGCATTTLQTQSKLTRTVVLDHSKNENKTMYLQVTNTAGGGGENMQLFEKLKQKLTQKGYTLVNTSKNAEYGLFVNVLFANNLREANAIKAGLNIGVLSGGSSAIAGSSGKDALLVGVTAALGSAIVGKAFEDEIFRAVIDVRIRDYSSKNTLTYRTENDVGSAPINTQRAGNVNQLAGPIGLKDGAGDMSSGISESISTVTDKDFEEYKTRAFVEAVRVDLKLFEAMPILEDKASTQIANLF
jgi:hypothetical protein